MRQNLDKFKIPLALSLLGVVLIVGGVFASGLTKPPKQFPKESMVQNQKMISADVSGAVIKPGVYQLDSNSRVGDAIKAAGGFAQNSNQEYISKYLNMAQKLSDGSKIYVPLAGEQVSGVQTGVAAAPGNQAQTKVNLNTATQPELEALPGIGPVTASKIISDRPYQQIGDLLNKKVVSKAIFEKIKDSLVLY